MWASGALIILLLAYSVVMANYNRPLKVCLADMTRSTLQMGRHHLDLFVKYF